MSESLPSSSLFFPSCPLVSPWEQMGGAPRGGTMGICGSARPGLQLKSVRAAASWKQLSYRKKYVSIKECLESTDEYKERKALPVFGMG